MIEHRLCGKDRASDCCCAPRHAKRMVSEQLPRLRRRRSRRGWRRGRAFSLAFCFLLACDFFSLFVRRLDDDDDDDDADADAVVRSSLFVLSCAPSLCSLCSPLPITCRYGTFLLLLREQVRKEIRNGEREGKEREGRNERNQSEAMPTSISSTSCLPSHFLPPLPFLQKQPPSPPPPAAAAAPERPRFLLDSPSQKKKQQAGLGQSLGERRK